MEKGRRKMRKKGKGKEENHKLKGIKDFKKLTL